MKNNLKIIGKIILWTVPIYILMMINVTITEILTRVSHSPFYAMGPLPFSVTLIEISLIYLLFFVLRTKNISERRKKFIYYIAALCIIYGFVQLFRTRYFLRYIFAYDVQFYRSYSQFLSMATFSFIYNFFIPIMAIIGGGLLFKFKEWGRRIIIEISVILYFIGLLTSIGHCVYTIVYAPYAGVIKEQLLENGDVVIVQNQYWPTYIISFLALLLILYFTRPKVKEMFK